MVEDSGYGFAIARATGGDDLVTIERFLGDDNGFTGSEGWDPYLSISIGASRECSKLHPDDTKHRGETLEHIRASQLNLIISALVDAVAAGRRAGIIPPPLTSEQWEERLAVADQVRALTAAPRSGGRIDDEKTDEPSDPPTFDATGDEDDGPERGDAWKRK